MRPSQARFVTLCQQLLAIGAVLAVLGPAANVVSLDVVIPRPSNGVDASAGQPHLTRLPGTPAGRRASNQDKPSRVETAPVEPVVTEIPLAHEGEAAKASEEFVSKPQKVDGFGTVGVTWSGKQKVSDDEITVMVRTRDKGKWSNWQQVQYTDEHGPDPDSREGRNARPGTEPLIIGDVDEVQAKAVTADGVEPEDMSLAVIEPGKSKGTEMEEPAIDTAKLGSSAGEGSSDGEAEGASADGAAALALQAGSFTPKPRIFSRAQWGADEKMRDASSLHYFEVHAGFVHHTVNANDYTKAEVPGILRSIYAYHVRTRGWSDVGYNFLVDRFGRIWEGRYGGVDRPVVGAHTLGYNDYSFAMSAIGNFETAQPSSAMLQAYGRLFAWKLSLHGVDAGSMSQQVGPDKFNAINGHRDAASTACPGRNLYAKIPTIREYAVQAQADWTGRDLATSVIGSSMPDLLVRSASGAGFVVPTNGLLRFEPGVSKALGGLRYDTVVATPDVTGDEVSDLFVRRTDGTAGIRPGNATVGYGARKARTGQFKGLDQITAVGDVNDDGHNDLVARNPENGKLLLFRGNGDATFDSVVISEDWAGYNLTAGTGDVNGDGLADVLARDTVGDLWLHAGTGSKVLSAPVKVNGNWGKYDVITGFGDFTRDGSADLFARDRSTGKGYVVPGKGNGKFRHWLGPFGNVGGLRSISGAQLLGGRDADLLGVKGDDLMVVKHRGSQNTLPRVSVGKIFADADTVLNAGDWDRDGLGDVVTRVAETGQLLLRRGLGGGKFDEPVELATGFGKVRLLAAVGDTTGDGWPDLMGQPKSGAMRIYPGKGLSGLKRSYVARGSVTAVKQLGLGRWDGDGAPDNLFRDGDSLKVLRGNGPGGLTGSAKTIASGMTAYDWVLSPGDVTGDGRPDLVVREKATGYLWVLPGRKAGFSDPRFLADGFGGYVLAG